MKTINIKLVLLSACFALSTSVFASAKDSVLWEFSANTVMPQLGTTKFISGSNYGVTYKDKKLVVYLPYYGRSYSSADIYSVRSPLDFTSKDFTIEKKALKKGRIRYTIHIKDNIEVQTLNFIFYDNGEADLGVVMSSRSPISFTGSISPLQQ